MATLDESLLQVHNYQESDCSPVTENRFTSQSNGRPLYCWKGTVLTSPQCITAEVCSPLSFTDARNKFCYTFGGSKDPRNPGDSTCVPGRLVSNLPGMSATVDNQRGGVVTYDEANSCQGINGWLHCLGTGIRQSMNEDPKFLERAAIALGALFGIAIALRYTGIGVKVKKEIPTVFNTKLFKPVKH